MRNRRGILTAVYLFSLMLAAACGTTDPSGENRGTLGEGATGSTSSNTTVQSSGGSISCSVQIQNPVTAGAATPLVLTVSGATGPITVEGTGISGVTNATQFNLVDTFTTTSSGQVIVHPSFTVSDTHNTAVCTYTVIIN